jgi:hypothetical protein
MTIPNYSKDTYVRAVATLWVALVAVARSVSGFFAISKTSTSPGMLAYADHKPMGVHTSRRLSGR